MMMKEIYEFLQNLEANNNKEWFDKNRDLYQKTRQQLIYFTEVLINEIRSFDPGMPLIDPKDCLFRIFRDLRFSKDKVPYKTNYGTHISKDGRNGGFPGYYFHIQPGGCFLSGGIYLPKPEFLKAIRNEIYYHVDEFIDIIEEPKFKSTFTFFDENKMKTNPKGFPNDFKQIDLLRYRSYAPYLPITEEQLFSKDLLDFIIERFKILYPFNMFINQAIGNIEQE